MSSVALWRRAGFWFLAALACFAPCSALFPDSVVFNNDWINHSWEIGYFGLYFREHLQFPQVLQTPELVGMAAPVFYGYLFFPVLGLLSAVVGTAMAVRLGFLLLTALEFALVYSAAFRLSRDRSLGFTVACLVIWAVYPLTNLYHRAALPELFATGFLTCAFGAAVLWQASEDPAGRVRFFLLSVLCLVLAIGMHPITGFLGGPATVLAVSLTRARFGSPKDPTPRLAWWGGGALAVVTLAPWVFAVLYFLPRLNVPGYLIFFPRFDSILWRVWPLPFDPGVRALGLASESPYLEAQCNMALALLVGMVAGLRATSRDAWNAAPRRRAIGFVMLLLVLTVLLSSLPFGPTLGRRLGIHKLLGIAQLAYRYTTYINYFLLVLFFLILGEERRKMRGAWLLWGLPLLLAATGLWVKLDHARQTQRHLAGLPWEDAAALGHLPATFYGMDDYSITRGEKEWEPSDLPLSVLTIPVLVGEKFGEVGPADTETRGKGDWILTNASPFPWGRFLADCRPLASEDSAFGHRDRLVDDSSIGVSDHWRHQPSSFRALRLPPGTRRVTWEWRPSLIWRLLRGFSYPTLIVWFLGVVGMFLAVLFPSSRWC